jgi:hypothetical protein
MIPITVYVMVRGAPPPESRLSKYYRAERYLFPVSNLFVVLLGIIALVRLGVHFGFIGAATNDLLQPIIHVPFFLFLLAVLFLWIGAIRKVRRQQSSS